MDLKNQLTKTQLKQRPNDKQNSILYKVNIIDTKRTQRFMFEIKQKLLIENTCSTQML